jgi:hypothetical protein
MLNYVKLPFNLRGGTQRYIEQGIPPGSFLTAVLENKLKESFIAADDENRDGMFHIVSWFYNEAPLACWGSPEKVAAWKEAGGLVGLTALAEAEELAELGGKDETQ